MVGSLRFLFLCLTMVWAAVFSFRGGIQDSSDQNKQTLRQAFFMDADQQEEQEPAGHAVSRAADNRAMGLPGEIARMLKTNGKSTSHRHLRHSVHPTRVLSHHHGGHAFYAHIPQLAQRPQLSISTDRLASLPTCYRSSDYYVYGLRKILI